MTHTFGNNEALLRCEIDNVILEIDQKPSVQNEKEFINILVFVPVIFALHDRQPDDGVIHFAKRLVIPFVGAGIGQLLRIDELERPVQNVQVSFVRKILRELIEVHDWNLDAEQATGNRVSSGRSVAYPSSVIPSEVEESLDLSLHARASRDVSTPLDMTIAHSSPSK